MTESLIYDLGAAGRRGVLLPDCDVPESPLPTELNTVGGARDA